MSKPWINGTLVYTGAFYPHDVIETTEGMAVMDDLETERTRLHRSPARGHYDRATIHAILDAAPLAHVAVADGDEPVVRPMTPWRVGETLYVHTARNGQLAQLLLDGHLACISVALLDGLVLARSACRHSVNYRSVTLFAKATEIADKTAKERLLNALVDKLTPGRSPLLRPVTAAERDSVLVLAFPIDEASAKLRSGPPLDLEKDRAWPVWAGQLPLAWATLPPQPVSGLADGLTPPRPGPWIKGPVS